MPANGAASSANEQTATFDFGRELAPGNYRLDIDYRGKINTQANGLFALDYKNVEGKDARALVHPVRGARRAPLRAQLGRARLQGDLRPHRPDARRRRWRSATCRPHRAEPIAGGLKEVTFAHQPGDVDLSAVPRRSAISSGSPSRSASTEVGIVMSRGNAEKARYALDAEAQLLPYFNDYFGMPYPLPKLDNVAGPGQSQFFGAMENWGAIFTFERILLLDPAITTEARPPGDLRGRGA